MTADASISVAICYGTLLLLQHTELTVRVEIHCSLWSRMTQAARENRSNLLEEMCVCEAIKTVTVKTGNRKPVPPTQQCSKEKHLCFDITCWEFLLHYLTLAIGWLVMSDSRPFSRPFSRKDIWASILGLRWSSILILRWRHNDPLFLNHLLHQKAVTMWSPVFFSKFTRCSLQYKHCTELQLEDKLQQGALSWLNVVRPSRSIRHKRVH